MIYGIRRKIAYCFIGPIPRAFQAIGLRINPGAK